MLLYISSCIVILYVRKEVRKSCEISEELSVFSDLLYKLYRIGYYCVQFFFIFKTQMVNGVKKVFEFLVYFLKYIKRQ